MMQCWLLDKSISLGDAQFLLDTRKYFWNATQMHTALSTSAYRDQTSPHLDSRTVYYDICTQYLGDEEQENEVSKPESRPRKRHFFHQHKDVISLSLRLHSWEGVWCQASNLPPEAALRENMVAF